MPQPLPAAWIGRLGRREPLPYVQVEPLLVAEIVVDQAHDRGRFRHPVRHLRLRALGESTGGVRVAGVSAGAQ